VFNAVPIVWVSVRVCGLDCVKSVVVKLCQVVMLYIYGNDVPCSAVCVELCCW